MFTLVFALTVVELVVSWSIRVRKMEHASAYIRIHAVILETESGRQRTHELRQIGPRQGLTEIAKNYGGSSSVVGLSEVGEFGI